MKRRCASWKASSGNSNPNVELDASIRLYERGALLKKRCEAKLKEAEEKVAAITEAERYPATFFQLDNLGCST